MTTRTPLQLDYLPPQETFLDPLREDAGRPREARCVVIPFGLEASVSYGGGTRTGPAAILKASHQLELFDDDDGDGKAGNPYLGGFGYIPSSQRAVATSRLTEGLTSSATQNGLLRVGKDELYVFDLKNLEMAGGGIERDGGKGEPDVRLA